MNNRIGKWLILCGLLLLLGALWKKNALPPPQELKTELLDEPEQVEFFRQPFQVTVGEIEYGIRPLYKYELYGMVVSKHDANTWWDYLHKEWNDKLNITDLCVIWGNNARSGAYRDISFSSAQFTCNFETSSSGAWAAFDTAAISNNHLLSADHALASKMRDVRIGDQIHFSGYLAEYSHNHGFPFKRGTSTVRTDSGNGACETVYVEAFEVLRRGGGPWPTMQWFGIGLMIAGVIAWFSLPVRLDQR
jgi:hypothetical protein